MATSPPQVEVAIFRQEKGLHEISSTTTSRQDGQNPADIIVTPLLLDTLYVSGCATFADWWEDLVSEVTITCLEAYLYPGGDRGPTVARAVDARSRRRLEDTEWMAAVRPGGLVGDGPTVCHLEIRDPSGGLVRISVGPAKRGSYPVVVRPEARVLYAHAFKHGGRQAPYDVLTASCAIMQGMGIYVDWTSAKVARVDVAADHAGYAWKRCDLDNFAGQGGRGKAGNRSEGADEHRCSDGTTLYVGRRSGETASWTIYDKTAEAKISAKTEMMTSIWSACGLPANARIWRLELSLGGRWLRTRRTPIATLRDLTWEALESVWRERAVKIRHVHVRRTRARREQPSAVWLALIEAAGVTACPWDLRAQPRAASRNAKHLIRQASGCLRSAITAMGGGREAYGATAAELADGFCEGADRADDRRFHLLVRRRSRHAALGCKRGRLADEVAKRFEALRRSIEGEGIDVSLANLLWQAVG